MLEQIFVFDVVDLNYMVLEGAEEVVVKWHTQHGQDMSNVSFLESVTPAQREHATKVSIRQPVRTRETGSQRRKMTGGGGGWGCAYPPM